MRKYLIAGLLILTLMIKGDTGGGETSLCFTGDILLDRGVRGKILENGYDYPYKPVEDILKKADITFGNLECPLTDRGIPNPGDRSLRFMGDMSNARYLKDAGYDVLNLANNHSLDWGPQGLKDTVNALERQDIHCLGVNVSGVENQKLLVIRSRGTRIGFLGYSDVYQESGWYEENSFGIFPMDEDVLKEDIEIAGDKCDFLIVSFHFGNEYDYYPNREQKNIARLAVDYGADLVTGHHPHVLQGYEIYSGKYIFYSLGNFVFDRQVADGTDESIILNLTIDKSGVKHMEILPVKIINFRPCVAEGGGRDYILDRMELYSKGID